MFTSIKRIFKSGWLSFSRDGGLTAATCFIMMMTILLITSLFLFKNVSQSLVSIIQEKADISVYFKENTQEKDIFNVKEELSKVLEVKNVKYVSKEKALESFSQRHKSDLVLMESLEEVGGNPFLAALNIKAFEVNQYQEVANFLENSHFENLIEKIDYHQRKPVIKRIFALTSGMEKVGISLSITLFLIAILVAFNTVRLAILNQKEEIKVQKLVGASNWFIRGPFLVQGAISGFLAALICLLIFASICFIFSPKIEILFSDLNIWGYFTNNFWTLFFIQFVTGIGLGVISSAFAVKKYLRI